MDALYSLRRNFTIVGITGRIGSGCSEIAERLSDENFNDSLKNLLEKETSDIDQLKLNICVNFLSNNKNWIPFKVINYKDVLLFHLVYEAIYSTNSIDEAVDDIINIITQNGSSKNENFENRFDINDSYVDEIKEYLLSNNIWYNYVYQNFKCDSWEDCLKSKKECADFYDFYFKNFENFSKDFYSFLNKKDITKRNRLTHDLANNLRESGTVRSSDSIETNLESIYTVAETINRLIKNWKTFNDETKIIIDSLKNSLELMYFKEKYAAFYTIATNKSELERREYVKKTINEKYLKEDKSTLDSHISNLFYMDNTEYKGNEVNDGKFSSPDVENCIQKSDYHIFWSKIVKTTKTKFATYEAEIVDESISLNQNEKENLIFELNNYHSLNLNIQLAKFVALIHQPGIITPTAYERNMQIAYNAKLNSGCISRKVGAVVSDRSFSVKAVGWNDVPRFQVPCNLRSISDLLNNENESHFSDFELGRTGIYKDGKTFIKNFKDELSNNNNVDLDKLEGRNCSFCFKTFHNAFEGEKNQVHTRSLHAEENAMLQISKYGGQGLKDGNLFTTASPCELCSKKAFQLGIKSIFYIDPYPGIATKHILRSGRNKEERPQLFMFQGAIGKAYQKLYEPFLSYKDELTILTGISPKITRKQKIQGLTDDDDTQEIIEKILSDNQFKQKITDLNSGI